MNKIEWIGIPVIVGLGTLLHYTYVGSGENLIVGFVSAMNESVWEHLKLAFWPGVLWTLFLAWGLGWHKRQNFWLARLCAVTIGPLAIVLLFYGYTAVLGGNLLVIDIGIFVIAIVLGQWSAILIYAWGPSFQRLSGAARGVIVLEGLMFIALSIWQPDLRIFVPPIHALN